MKKYLIGILIGVALTFSATTYAADITSLIGKTVQGVFPVKVNGNALPQTAIVIDGTSYLPVRAIGDAIGYDVSFNADLGIELKKKEVVPVTTPDATASTAINPTPTPIPKPTDSRTDTLKLFINADNEMLSFSQESLKRLQDYVNGGGKEDVSAKITEYKGNIEKLTLKLEKEKAELATLTQ